MVFTFDSALIGRAMSLAMGFNRFPFETIFALLSPSGLPAPRAMPAKAGLFHDWSFGLTDEVQLCMPLRLP